MKIAYVIVFIILVLFACGCTATTSVSGIPDLTGTWTGTMQGYDGTRFTDYGNSTMSMIVTEQHGRIITGNLLFTWNGTLSTTQMTGVIGRDGKTFSIVEKNNGYTNGEIVSTDTIELIWRNDAPLGAALDTLKRV